MSAYLIRHAESTANAGQVTQHPDNIPLTPLGQSQAQALAERLVLSPSLFVLSPFTRAQATAAPLLARHPQVPVQVQPVQEFTYLNTRRWAGTTAEQRWPAVAHYWATSNPNVCEGEGCESFCGLMARADALLALLAERQHLPGSTVVVSHGIFICAVLWRALATEGGHPLTAASMAQFRAFQQQLQPANVSIARLTWRERWQLGLPLVLC